MTPITGSTRNLHLTAYRDWLLALGVSAAVGLAIVGPFFWLGNASGHDIEFHAASWLDVAGQWKEGIFCPRWAEWANHGFGEPRFIFYPPLSWMLGAALGLAVPWNAVPGVFVVVAQTMAGLCAFALARRLLPERASILAAAFYAANPYALLVVYLRSDFAEELASAFFPLLILVALQMSRILESRCASKSKTIASFAVVFAAIWLSNAPAGVLASYTVALLLLWGTLTEKSWKPLAHGAGGLTLSFGLAGFYLLPAAYEQRWVNIGQALSSGLRPSDNFLYTMINDPEHNAFNWIASSVAILLIVLTGIAVIAARKAGINTDGVRTAKEVSNALLLLAAAATILMLRPTSIFWALLPKLRFVQFPWRWMAILAVPYAYFLAAALTGRRRFWWVWAAVVLAATGGTAVFLVQHAWWDADDIPVLQAAIAKGAGYDGTDEYDPRGDDHYNLPAEAPPAQVLPSTDEEGRPAEARLHVERWTAEEKVLRVSSREPGRLALRLLNYPAWRVEVNGKEVSPEETEGTGQIMVPLHTGESFVTAHFARTADRTFGGAFSLLSALISMALYWHGRPKPIRSTTTGR